MAVTKHSAYGTFTTVLTTQLNSLAANANSAASAAIDNSTSREMFLDLRLVTGATASRSGGLTVGAFIVPAIDGSTYDSENEITCEALAVFPYDSGTAARNITRLNCPIPPGLFKLFVRNQLGVAFASSGNTLAYRMHSVEVI